MLFYFLLPTVYYFFLTSDGFNLWAEVAELYLYAGLGLWTLQLISVLSQEPPRQLRRWLRLLFFAGGGLLVILLLGSALFSRQLKADFCAVPGDLPELIIFPARQPSYYYLTYDDQTVTTSHQLYQVSCQTQFPLPRILLALANPKIKSIWQYDVLYEINTLAKLSMAALEEVFGYAVDIVSFEQIPSSQDPTARSYLLQSSRYLIEVDLLSGQVVAVTPRQNLVPGQE